MKTRFLLLAVVCLSAAFVATNAEALPCQEVTTTYYGHYAIDGSTFCYWGGGPPQTPDIIGQRHRDCWGNVTTWGNTSCEMYPPTYEYLDCDCNYASSETGKASEQPACKTAPAERAVN